MSATTSSAPTCAPTSKTSKNACAAAADLEFEEAGRLRDEIIRLEKDELGLPDDQKKAPLVGRSNEGKPGTRKMRYGKTQRKWGR